MSFEIDSVDGVALLLWSADPDTPERLATPFFVAAAAAAMDVPVEIYFSACSVRLLAPGVAEQLHASSHPKSILDAMREARDHGAQLLACADALAAQGLAPDGLIAECDGTAGAVAFMARACDPRWRALVF